MLHPFKRHRLGKEAAEIRRLMWICEMKKSMFRHSQIRKEYNSKRDRQLIILKELGMPIEEIFEKAKSHECLLELVNN